MSERQKRQRQQNNDKQLARAERDRWFLAQIAESNAAGDGTYFSPATLSEMPAPILFALRTAKREAPEGRQPWALVQVGDYGFECRIYAVMDITDDEVVAASRAQFGGGHAGSN